MPRGFEQPAMAISVRQKRPTAPYHLCRAIVDRFNIIPADSEIGVDPVIDRRRHHVDPSGIVVVPRGGRREFLLGLEEF